MSAISEKNVRAGFSLTLTATSGAAADGADTNSLTATLMNGNNYVDGADIDLSVISGTAVFSSGLSHTTATTNTLGEASASLTDTVEETVTVKATLLSDTTVTAQATTTFGDGGGDDDSYPAPVVVEASSGVLSPSVSQATVRIAPYDGMAVGDSVVLSWLGKTSAGNSQPEYTASLTVTTITLLTFTVPAAQIAAISGGSVAVSYTVNGKASDILSLAVTASPETLLVAPAVREAAGSQLSKLISTATVDIAPWTGMAAGDLVELGWNGSATGKYTPHLTVSGATAGKTVSFSVPAAQLQGNAQVALNYTVTPADGGSMQISLPLALRIV